MTGLAAAVVFLTAVVVAVPVFRRAGLGGVLGYLVTGAVLGPLGLGVLSGNDEARHVAEFGVVLLMFLIGLELEPRRLWAQRTAVFGLGGAQVVVTGAALAVAALWLGVDARPAVVLGLSLALSSTALVLQLLGERRELTVRHGRDAFAVLLLQDLAVLPLVALVPTLGSGPDGGTPDDSPVVAALRLLAVVAFLVAVSRLAIRPLFRHVVATRSEEVYVAASLLVVCSAALVVHLAGLSMSLGAFLAGMLLADSQYRHQIEADVLPFKHLLLGLFFASVGMAADPRLLVTQPATLLGLTVGLMAIKAVVAALLALAFGADRPSALRLGVVLAQGGEFAFVLLTLARAHALLDGATERTLVMVITLSMATTPLVLGVVDRVLGRVRRTPHEPPAAGEPTTFVLIAGMGAFGRGVAMVLRAARVPFVAFDRDRERVELARRLGVPVYIGDGTRLDFLRVAGLERATALVLAIDDEAASLRLATLARAHAPSLYVLARAHSRLHAHRLLALGAAHVQRDVLPASLAIADRLLQRLGMDAQQAERLVERCRAWDEEVFARQQALHEDEAAWLADSREAARELEHLLELETATSDPTPN
jgi:monovalent cation:proton antiporter-2 (CPA2) family protein